MSFIRPAARQAIQHYGEPAALSLITIWAIWQGSVMAADGRWLALVPAGVCVVAILALFAWIERTMVAWKSRHTGPGVVVIDEGRIAFLGPAGGVVMAVDMLVVVEVWTEGDRMGWYLADELGQTITIPGGAVGAEALLDRLGTLQGFDHFAMIGAMRGDAARRTRVWSRQAQLRRRSG